MLRGTTIIGCASVRDEISKQLRQGNREKEREKRERILACYEKLRFLNGEPRATDKRAVQPAGVILAVSGDSLTHGTLGLQSSSKPWSGTAVTRCIPIYQRLLYRGAWRTTREIACGLLTPRGGRFWQHHPQNSKMKFVCITVRKRVIQETFVRDVTRTTHREMQGCRRTSRRETSWRRATLFCSAEKIFCTRDSSGIG